MRNHDSAADRLVLRPFTVADEQSARAGHRELAAEQFEFLLEHSPDSTWAEYLAHLDDVSHGLNLAPDRVAADLLAADVDGELVGRVSIRHSIDTPFLAEFGGHIGYATRPAYRRRGFARAMLRLALVRARQLGLDSALLTCDDDNLGSAATIESCGGVLANRVPFEAGHRRRYWVPTAFQP